MTDQVNNTNSEAPSGNEVEARAGGWVPKEDYHGDENKWVDADEFVRRGPLFEKINAQSRELKETKKAIEQLKSHYSNVKETAYKEALAALKTQKRDAFSEGDPDKIIEIDDKIEQVKEEQRQYANQRQNEVAQAAQSQGVDNPVFQAWVSRNTWYSTSKPMKAFADALGIELQAAGHSPADILKKVELKVKDEFTSQFQNANRSKPGAVEGVSKGGGKSSRGDDLTEMERGIMQRFVRQGVMTEEQYIADIKKTRDSK